jgi:hypothetical protein
MKPYNSKSQISLAGKPALLPNSSSSSSPTFYRNIGLITGCALLATSGIAGGCIFVAALPLFPVLLVGVTIAIALAAVCIWSICRLKKLNGEPKKQEHSSEPPEEEKPPVKIPGDENPQGGASETPGPETNLEGGNSQIEDNGIPNSEVQFTDISNEPHPDGEEPSVTGGNKPPLNIQTKENMKLAKMQNAKDVNDPEVIEQLSTAHVLYFYGKQDDKFLFECAQSASNPDESKICFFTSDIDDVWEKSGRAHCLYFSSAPHENLKISGDKLKNLGNIFFSFDGIKNFEVAEHITGTFVRLKGITFYECSHLQSASISGDCIAQNFHSIKFDNCPNLNEVHIENEVPAQIGESTASRPNSCWDPIVQRVHIHPGSRLFGSTGKITVQLDNCQNLLAKQTYFDTIRVNNDVVCGNSKCAISTTTCFEMNSTLKRKPNLRSANGISTIDLQLPSVAAKEVKLEHGTLDPHVVINFDLKKYESIELPSNIRIAHLEFAKPMDDCSVKFAAHQNGVLLEINGLQQLPKKPFKMFFWSLKKGKLPNINLNGAVLKGIFWYQHNVDGANFLTPVIPENCGKAEQAGLKAAATNVWPDSETIELNSAFLLP